MNQATGLISTAVTSQPSRIASKGIAPPPANGSSTLGARPPYAFLISARNQSMSGLFSLPQCRTPPSVRSLTTSTVLPPTFFFWTSVTTFPPIFSSSSFRFCGVPGSGSSVAISAARHAASGRRAGQMWSVEMCPWRTFFSWTESRDACLRGKATSMRRGRSASGIIAFRDLGQQFGGGQNRNRRSGEALRVAGDDGVEVGEDRARDLEVVLEVRAGQARGRFQGLTIDGNQREGVQALP